jgi:hypothetical protein
LPQLRSTLAGPPQGVGHCSVGHSAPFYSQYRCASGEDSQNSRRQKSPREDRGSGETVAPELPGPSGATGARESRAVRRKAIARRTARKTGGCILGDARPGLAAAGLGGGARAALHHAQHVAALAARLATQLVHEGAHQKHTATADALFGRVQVRDCRQVKRSALVDKENLDAVGPEETLDLKRRVGLSAVGVTDDVVGGLVGCQDDGIGCLLVKTGHLTHRPDKSPRQGQEPQVARKRQRPRRLLSHPYNSTRRIVGTRRRLRTRAL